MSTVTRGTAPIDTSAVASVTLAEHTFTFVPQSTYFAVPEGTICDCGHAVITVQAGIGYTVTVVEGGTLSKARS